GAGIGDDGEADWEHIENIRTDLLNFTYTQVDSIYAHWPWQATSAMVTSALNNGRSIINYCGHGSMTSWSTTGFGNNHVGQLVNYNMLPWIVSVACANGKFHAGTCFAEAWMRAARDSQPTGAVGIYASSVNMSWAPPMAAQDETVDLLVADAKRTFGALCFSGSCQMMDEYGWNGMSEFKNWHVFGDPSLRVRSNTPGILTVAHEEWIDPEAVTFTVTVPGMEEALCGLSLDGEFLGSAFTDVSGVAEIPIVGQLPEQGSVTLTVTYFNSMPYFAEIEVGQALVPEMSVSPESFIVYVPLEATTKDTLYISNIGMEGSVLEFNICVMSSSVNHWLGMDPSSGEVLSDETAEVELTFDTHGFAAGIYHAELLISSNGGRATVPVTLYAGDYQDIDVRNEANILSLAPASPNPFGGATTIAFALPMSEPVRLSVYDMSGRLVRTLISGLQEAGPHRVIWDGRDDCGKDLTGGVYFYRLDSEGPTLTGKVMVVR
ncbi:MAG: T9SS type A sorting domain-containing protein, partial [Candidatus Eisenbacteria sp.]|nr:T9SS type A sorting domain-containing protein [Candidatus Eisenbacteria bacterium]